MRRIFSLIFGLLVVVSANAGPIDFNISGQFQVRYGEYHPTSNTYLDLVSFGTAMGTLAASGWDTQLGPFQFKLEDDTATIELFQDLTTGSDYVGVEIFDKNNLWPAWEYTRTLPPGVATYPASLPNILRFWLSPNTSFSTGTQITAVLSEVPSVPGPPPGSTPEPGAFAMLGGGILAVAGWARKRRAA